MIWITVQIERKTSKEVRINTLQTESDSVIEDLMNPKDELKKKIVAVAGTIRNWHDETRKARKSVRKQLKEILDLGLNKYKMKETEVRKLTEEIFLYHGISESWLRKLLPVELKDVSKTRLSYLQKQELEKERQRLLQQYPELRQRSEIKEFAPPDGSMVVSTGPQLKSQHELGFQEYSLSDGNAKVSETSDPRISISVDSVKIKLKIVQYKLDEAKKKIDRLETDVRQLSNPFVAKTYLRTNDHDIPLVAQVDPFERVITWIRFDKDAAI